MKYTVILTLLCNCLTYAENFDYFGSMMDGSRAAEQDNRSEAMYQQQHYQSEQQYINKVLNYCVQFQSASQRSDCLAAYNVQLR
jgi:hypothetical protein